MRTKEDLSDVKLSSGNLLQLYEPNASGQGGMQSGKCPRCNNGLRDYVGRCACIRELDKDSGQPVVGEYTSSFGHYDCVAMLFQVYANSIEEPEKSPKLIIWRYGTQREMILYVQGHGEEGKACVIQFDPLANRDKKYRYRIATEETE